MDALTDDRLSDSGGVRFVRRSSRRLSAGGGACGQRLVAMLRQPDTLSRAGWVVLRGAQRWLWTAPALWLASRSVSIVEPSLCAERWMMMR